MTWIWVVGLGWLVLAAAGALAIGRAIRLADRWDGRRRGPQEQPDPAAGGSAATGRAASGPETVPVPEREAQDGPMSLPEPRIGR